jgi:two-component system cell cycle sensor histidine kinase/response regulator CckA
MNWDEDAANREIVDRSDYAIVITDGQGRVLRMNGAAHLLGLQLGPALFEERPSSEIELCDVRGGLRKVSLTTTRLADVHVHLLRDVTEQRSLEREVRELRRLQSLGILVASVVHDMNNLLTAIVCSSALLERETARGGDGPALSAEIRQAAEQAVALLRRMLAFVRRTPAARAPINVAEVLEIMHSILSRVAGDGVKVRVTIGQDAGWVVADREQLEQVLINLAANARDAMPDGGELVFSARKLVLGDDEASTLHCPGAGTYVAVSATDTGVGMTSDVRDRMFDSFFTTKGEGSGTGLGLAAARRFATESGGCIRARSTLGQGTTLTLYLPRTQPEAAGFSPRDRDTPMPRGGETVLVVENDEHARSAVRTVLDRLGYYVVTAASGEQGLQTAMASEAPIDLLLTDVILPDLSGPALAERLLLAKRIAHVLFMSGQSQHVLTRHGIDGKVPLLRKAFSPAELARRVRETLDRDSRSTLVSAPHPVG